MHPILIFRHVECEGPGFLADFLDSHKLPHRLVCIDQGEPVPVNLDNISGLVFMGGSMSVNDPLPWIADEIALIAAAQAQGMPVLGHCLGGQLISKALGAEVTANRVREIGWLSVTKIAAELTAVWLHGLADEFEVFHWHGETFSIPAGATAILKSDYCDNQAFVIGKTLALQCHVEMTATMVKEWADLFAEQLQQPSPSLQSAPEMLQDLDNKVARLQSLAAIMYSHWLRGFQ